jgi:hypothetical protein
VGAYLLVSCLLDLLRACLLAESGGYRAATLALGYVRALHLLGLTSQARYLASNSGGSWFNAAFSYQQVTMSGTTGQGVQQHRNNMADAACRTCPQN